jgi:MoaA/NifB/PqqE/SkfB family radical SAM enzyme
MGYFSHPVLCNYYVTYRCNAQCSFCDLWEKPSPYVTLEQAEANLRDLKRLGVQVIDFTGGEPLLHRELPALLRRAKEHGFITTVTTNTLLYPKQAVELRGLVDMLHFSLDAATPDAHNASRGVDCYDFLLRSIHIARDLGERPDILFTVSNDNLADIDAVYNGLTQPNGLLLIINPMFSYAGYGEELKADHYPVMRKWAKRPGVYLNEGFIALREAGGNHTADPVCTAASHTIVISPENALRLPCYHLGIRDIPIEGHLYDLWHSAEVQQLRALEGRLPECEGCTINCYMQPSFANPSNRYFWQALPSTLKYSLEKWVYA